VQIDIKISEVHTASIFRDKLRGDEESIRLEINMVTQPYVVSVSWLDEDSGMLSNFLMSFD
jgi:hypothetical protein